MPNLRALVQGDRAKLEDAYQRLLAESNGTATGAMLKSDVNRGVVPGQASPWAQELAPADLAAVDRYAWGAQSGLGGLPVAIGYEVLKKASETPAFRSLLPAIASAVGFENTGNQFGLDETSSPASVSNVVDYARGALRNSGLRDLVLGGR